MTQIHLPARWFGLLAPFVAFTLVLAPAPLDAALPFISEIMPDNARILADEDGNFPDWLEIHNPGPGAVNLQGWFLTDNPALLTNWAFPSVNLSAGGYLVVFASGKNRTNDPAHLHTSFQLEASGEYLALVQPDGVTIASAFSPKFPSVREDVAFGIAQSLVVTSLLNGSVPRVLVPTNSNDLPPDWNLPGYVPDSRWTNGPSPPAAGFDTNQSSGLPSNVAPSGMAVQSTVNGSFTPNLALNGNLGDFTHTLGTDTSPFWQVTLTNQMFIHSVVLYNRTSCCGSRLRDITIEILATNDTGTVTNYTSALLNPENTGYTYPGGPPALTNDLVALTGTPVLGSIVRVRRTPDPDLSGTGGQGNTDEAAVLSLAEVVVNAGGAAGLRPYFTTDLQALMWNHNASAFVRLPFLSTNTPDVLTLKMRYDDGFIAYLNGVEIARRNAPAFPQWDSAATADRPLTNAVIQETLDASASIGGLVNGANVLGIQLLNSSADDPNALIQPELSATKLIITSNVFFTAPTPGTNNNTGWYYDEVADTHFSVDRGFFTNAFFLEITNGTPGSQIYYSFNADEPGPTKGILYTGPIQITNTTVVRARAFRDGWKPTDVDTHTYLFLADVIYQVPNWPANRIPPQYFPATWGANAVDYGMDPEIVTNYTLAQWYEALTQIPTMSVVTEMPNLFDATTGIYANASQHGEEWERPCSLELLDPTNSVPGRFQENCGLRIRGGFSRNNDFRKHSFRVFFRREYGAGKLNYPLFENEGADEFETFDVRTSQNYSWPRGSESPTFETMVREVFCRLTLGDMGQPYRRSRYYHLYLNGQYWGLYETDERPEASYGQTYFGGSKTNFDVVKCGNRGVTPTFATEATDGNLIAWSNLWTICQAMRTNPSLSNYFRVSGRDPDGSRNPALPVLIDLDNLIDYMLEIFYSGDGDATLSSFLGNNQANNWFGMRDRTNPDVGFRFFNSDCEHTLGSPSSQVDRTGPFGGSNEGIFIWSNPQWMHEELMRQLEYRVLFGDHVQKHFFNGGALTLQACTNRFIGKAKQITKAIRAYSARWGDANSTTAYGESHWTNAIAFCLNWLPARANIVLAQLTNDLLFPTLSAPTLSSYGGFVSPGFSLTMAQNNPGGVIYYTTNGTDPRLIGGATSGAAQTYSAPLTVEENLSVRARVKSGTNWSAVVEALFTTTQYFRDLAITEIMYNPPGAANVDGDEFEFLELKNTGPNNLNLSALAFTTGITFNFTNGTRLGPGAFFVLARNKAQFQARYPGVTVNGVYTGRLANEGETVRLTHSIGGQIFAVTYDDAPEWPQAADGLGFSLVPVSTSTNLNSDQPQHWRASSAAGGSPGADDPAPAIPSIVVNEVLTHTSTSVDFIELFNPSGAEVNVGGWFLTDDPSVPKKFRIPDGTTIEGGGYLVFTEPLFNPTPGYGTSFTLSAEGEKVFLFSGDAATNLTGYSHGFNFGAAAEGVTFGRYLISTGEEQFPAQITPTPGGLNSGPLIPNVVISEIHYNPRPGGDAFVEIKNRTGSPVPLYDTMRPTNTWRVNGIGFVFPTNVMLPAGGLALIVETPPAAFRSKYSVPAAVPVFGPYGGTLQDSGELVELQRLDFRGTNNVAWVTLDAVRYNDRAPWPVAADGAGASLQRINANSYGNEPTNWLAATPTPGGTYPAGAAPTITAHPASQFVVASLNVFFSVIASPTGPLRYQWRFNGGNIFDATNSTYSIINVQPSHAGRYSVAVFNDSGSAESTNAILTVGIPATITENPTNIAIRVPTDPRANPTNRVAVFRANAISMNPPLSYQWRFNSNNIAPNTPWFTGVTSNILTLTNVLVDHGGAYDCAVSDALGTIYTLPATLSALVELTFLERPASQTNVAGSPFTVSAVIAGTPAPFTYYWKSNSFLIGNLRTNVTWSFFTITSVLANTSTRYQLVVSNLASIGQGTQASFTNTTVLDGDGDGIPDFFELLHGPNATDFDPAGDKDGDGMRNLAEYLAGTDPSDAASFLKIDQTTVPGAATVLFGAVPGKTYTVQYTDRLPDGAWLKLADIVSKPAARVETIPDPNWSTNRYYRVVTPRQP